MWDIIAGTLIVLLLSVGLFSAGVVTVRRCSKRVLAAVGFGVALFILWFAVAVHGSLAMAAVLPYANVIVLGNCLLPAAGFLAGMVCGQRSSSCCRRLATAVPLLWLAWQTLWCHFPQTAPAAHDLWSQQRVCLQTTPSSCSACSAVMLLRDCEIPADEPEMIRLCLTGPKGTPALGLYRGLKIKTRGTPWKVNVVRGGLADLQDAAAGPVLIFVRLDAPVVVGRISTPVLWDSRIEHAVVVYGFTDDGGVLIGDPAQSKCRWSVDELQRRWTGEGLRLVPRSESPGRYRTLPGEAGPRPVAVTLLG